MASNGNQDATSPPDKLPSSSPLPPLSNLSLSPHKRHRPKPSSLPTSLVRTFQLHHPPIPTEITLQLFSDRTFLSLTQLHGKIGSLLLCTVEESPIDNSTTYDIRTLLGAGAATTSVVEKEAAFREVLVRRIAEGVVHRGKRAGVWDGGGFPALVVGVGLRPGGGRGVEELRGMVNAVMEVYEEGWSRRKRGGLVGMEGPD